MAVGGTERIMGAEDGHAHVAGLTGSENGIRPLLKVVDPRGTASSGTAGIVEKGDAGATGAVVVAVASPVATAVESSAESPTESPTESSTESSTESPAGLPVMVPDTGPASPSVGDAWRATREQLANQVRADWQAVLAAQAADPQSPYWISVSRSTGDDVQTEWRLQIDGPSGLRAEWLRAEPAALAALAAHHGVDMQALVGYGDGQYLNLVLDGTSVGLDMPVPAGRALGSTEELAAIDALLTGEARGAMNQVLIARFGSTEPVPPPASSVARQLAARYGLDRYQQLVRLERALDAVQDDFAAALKQASVAGSGPGWVDEAVAVEVADPTAMTVGDNGPAMITEWRAQPVFSAEAFSGATMACRQTISTPGAQRRSRPRRPTKATTSPARRPAATRRSPSGARWPCRPAAPTASCSASSTPAPVRFTRCSGKPSRNARRRLPSRTGHRCGW